MDRVERSPHEVPASPVGRARPAVVLGCDLTALGVTRCLAREGIPVVHLSCPGNLLEPSRWYRPITRLGPEELAGEPSLLAETLHVALGGSAVLFPCSDAFARTAASLVHGGSGGHAACLPRPEVVADLIDKARLAETAERAGVPVPPTTSVDAGSRLDELDDAWFRDSLVKPVDSQRFFRRFGVKSFPVTSRAETVGALRRVREAGMEAVLQRYVPGPPSAHLFLDGFRARGGETKGLLARRRERMFPPATGNSSSMVTVALEETGEAVEHLERLLDAAGFHGIFSAEFKEDAEDGVFRLLEVNARPWWYVEFTARCGVDVCAMAYREALGETVRRVEAYEVGRRCVYPYYDLFAGCRELRAGRLTALDWARSWLSSDRPVFARDDPLPALRSAWERARGFVRRRAGGSR